MEKESKQQKWKRFRDTIYRNALQLILVGSVTGVFSGAVVTFFNIIAEKGEEFSQGAYAFVRNNLALVPLLFLVLFLGAFLIGVAVRISEEIRGCGIPSA